MSPDTESNRPGLGKRIVQWGVLLCAIAIFAWYIVAAQTSGISQVGSPSANKNGKPDHNAKSGEKEVKPDSKQHAVMPSSKSGILRFNPAKIKQNKPDQTKTSGDKPDDKSGANTK